MVAHPSVRRARNTGAGWSVILALLGLAIAPAAWYLAEDLDRSHLDTTVVIGVATTIFGLAALVLARRATRRHDRTLGRVGGGRSALLGQILGVLCFSVGLSALLALLVYAILVMLGER